MIILTHDYALPNEPSAEIMLGYASREVFLQRVEMAIGNETLTNSIRLPTGHRPLSGNDLKLNTRNGKAFRQVVTVPVITDGVLTRIVLIVGPVSRQADPRARSNWNSAPFWAKLRHFAHEVKARSTASARACRFWV